MDRRRRPQGFERRLWQVQLLSYGAMTLSVFGDYFTSWMDQMFLLGVGALLVIGVGGIPFGVMLLRNRFRRVVTPVLLIGFIPFAVAVTTVTSLGGALLPLMWGWAVAAHTVASQQTTGAATVLADHA